MSTAREAVNFLRYDMQANPSHLVDIVEGNFAKADELVFAHGTLWAKRKRTKQTAVKIL
jgi:hypothetical protein